MSFISEEIKKFNKEYSINKFYFPDEKIRKKINKFFNPLIFFSLLGLILISLLFFEFSEKKEVIHLTFILIIIIFFTSYFFIRNYYVYALKKKYISTEYKKYVNNFLFNNNFFNYKLMDIYILNTEFNYNKEKIDFLLENTQKDIDNYSNKSFVIKPLGIITSVYVFILQILFRFKVIETYFEINMNNITFNQGMYISGIILLLYILIIIIYVFIANTIRDMCINENEYKKFIDTLNIIKIKKIL